eukprot:6480361-Amphidinium_carterae.1
MNQIKLTICICKIVFGFEAECAVEPRVSGMPLHCSSKEEEEYQSATLSARALRRDQVYELIEDNNEDAEGKDTVELNYEIAVDTSRINLHQK